MQSGMHGVSVSVPVVLGHADMHILYIHRHRHRHKVTILVINIYFNRHG